MKRGKTRNVARLGVMLIALMLLGGLLVSSPQAAQPWKVTSVPITGADGANNNTAFVNDRYIIVAPYAPSKVPTFDSAVEQLDNYNIYLVDSKRPTLAQSHPIETPGGDKRLFYPTKLIYDEDSRTVYVRGTRFEQVDGGVKEIAALAYIHVNLDDNGKPTFGNVVMIDIAGVGEGTTPDAPDDFALAFNGGLLVFTNGASVFTYDLNQGYLYHVDLVKQEAYDAGSRIAYLDVNAATNTLMVYWNSRQGEEGNIKATTELSFYQLDKGGTMQLKKRLFAYPEQFPEGVYIPAGSNIEMIGGQDSNGDFLPGSYAFVATSDGNLSQIDLTGKEVTSSLKPLAQFDAMASREGAEGSPRVLKYDATKRTIGIVMQGFRSQIRKPTNGRPGKIGSVVRTLRLFNAVESPTLAVARLSKNFSKVTGSRVYADEFRGEEGLTRLVDGQNGQWLVATHSGKVLGLSTANAIDSTDLNLLTEVGPRTGRIAYSISRDSVVAINSFGLDASQEQIAEAGALVVARQAPSTVQSLSIASVSVVTVTAANHTTSRQGPGLSIRRPCNISRE
jgi:hypothetical protein